MPTKSRKSARITDDEARRRRELEPIYRTVGGRVRQLRDEHQLSQESLSATIGMSQNLLARIESGSRRVPLHSLEAIARGLGVPLRSLLPPDNASESDLSPALQKSISRLAWKDQAILRKLADRLAAGQR